MRTAITTSVSLTATDWITNQSSNRLTFFLVACHRPVGADAVPLGLDKSDIKRNADRRTEPLCWHWHWRPQKSGASATLAFSLHRAFRLTRCRHMRHLADLVTTCGCICLRVQRELMRVQRTGGRRRLGDVIWLLHDDSKVVLGKWIKTGLGGLRDCRKRLSGRLDF